MSSRTIVKRTQKRASKNGKGDFIMPFTDKPLKDLTPRQEKFAQLYASNSEFFGNGVQSYISAYKKRIKTERDYNIVRALAARLLSNENVIRRISDLLDNNGFNNANVDKQHSFLIQQFKDFPTKMRAIEHYNKVKQRVDDKINQNITFNTLAVLAQQAEKDETQENITPGILSALDGVSDAEIVPEKE